MIQVVCAVRDRVSGEFAQPIFELNEDTAKRSFAIAVKSGNSLLSSAPEDFELHLIGSYDTSSGIILGCQDEILCRGTDYAEV